MLRVEEGSCDNRETILADEESNQKEYWILRHLLPGHRSSKDGFGARTGQHEHTWGDREDTEGTDLVEVGCRPWKDRTVVLNESYLIVEGHLADTKDLVGDAGVDCCYRMCSWLLKITFTSCNISKNLIKYVVIVLTRTTIRTCDTKYIADFSIFKRCDSLFRYDREIT